ERVAVHARQLAFEPDLQIIRRSRRPLLRGLEQARRSAVAHHVYRIASMGARVLINGTRYKLANEPYYPGHRHGEHRHGRHKWKGPIPRHIPEARVTSHDLSVVRVFETASSANIKGGSGSFG